VTVDSGVNTDGSSYVYNEIDKLRHQHSSYVMRSPSSLYPRREPDILPLVSGRVYSMDDIATYDTNEQEIASTIDEDALAVKSKSKVRTSSPRKHRSAISPAKRKQSAHAATAHDNATNMHVNANTKDSPKAKKSPSKEKEKGKEKSPGKSMKKKTRSSGRPRSKSPGVRRKASSQQQQPPSPSSSLQQPSPHSTGGAMKTTGSSRHRSPLTRRPSSSSALSLYLPRSTSSVSIAWADEMTGTTSTSEQGWGGDSSSLMESPVPTPQPPPVPREDQPPTDQQLLLSPALRLSYPKLFESVALALRDENIAYLRQASPFLQGALLYLSGEPEIEAQRYIAACEKLIGLADMEESMAAGLNIEDSGSHLLHALLRSGVDEHVEWAEQNKSLLASASQASSSRGEGINQYLDDLSLWNERRRIQKWIEEGRVHSDIGMLAEALKTAQAMSFVDLVQEASSAFDALIELSHVRATLDASLVSGSLEQVQQALRECARLGLKDEINEAIEVMEIRNQVSQAVQHGNEQFVQDVLLSARDALLETVEEDRGEGEIADHCRDDGAPHPAEVVFRDIFQRPGDEFRLEESLLRSMKSQAVKDGLHQSNSSRKSSSSPKRRSRSAQESPRRRPRQLRIPEDNDNLSPPISAPMTVQHAVTPLNGSLSSSKVEGERSLSPWQKYKMEEQERQLQTQELLTSELTSPRLKSPPRQFVGKKQKFASPSERKRNKDTNTANSRLRTLGFGGDWHAEAAAVSRNSEQRKEMEATRQAIEEARKVAASVNELLYGQQTVRRDRRSMARER
jgi:hypothetical protein